MVLEKSHFSKTAEMIRFFSAISKKVQQFYFSTNYMRKVNKIQKNMSKKSCDEMINFFDKGDFKMKQDRSRRYQHILSF